jgi:hypothetical protein
VDGGAGAVSTVTCHTDGCANNGIPIELDLTYTDPDTGETVTVGGVICGPCGQPITDIEEASPR